VNILSKKPKKELKKEKLKGKIKNFLLFLLNMNKI